MKAIILAGGKGTRLLPITKVLPKSLFPVGDKTIVEYLLQKFKAVGINQIYLSVGYLDSLLRFYFQDGSKFGVNIEYIFEEKPMGTIGSLTLVKGLDQTFIVTNGDILTTLNFKDLLIFHKKHSATATIAVYPSCISIDYGVMQWGKLPLIAGIIEKPKIKYYINMGIYVFEPKVIEYIPKNKSYNLPDLLKQLINNGEPVIGYKFSGYWRDIGNLQDYLDIITDSDQIQKIITSIS